DMIIHHYPEILAGDITYATKAREVAQRTYEFSQFLVDVLGVTNLQASATEEARLRHLLPIQGVQAQPEGRRGNEETRALGCLTYHASCHGLRGLGIKEQPRQL